MKKTLVLFLAMMAVFAFGVCAIELDTAENAADVVAEDAVLAASADVELKPGINLWTGTTAPYTFDGDYADISGFDTNGVSVVSWTSSDGNTTTNTLLIDKSLGYMGKKDFPVIEVDRPVRIKYTSREYLGQVRVMASSDVTGVGAGVADVCTLNGGAKTVTINVTATQTGTWVDGNNNSVDTFKEAWRNKSFENLYLYGFSTTMKNYVDDVSVIPYYKLTYDVNGGTGAEFASTYFYVEEGTPYTSVADGSALTKGGKAFAGWALTANATPNDVIVNLYPTPGSDITLYAVYGEAEKATFKPGINIFTGTEEAFTFNDYNEMSKLLTNGVTVVDYPTEADASNKALKYTAKSQYIALKNFPEVEVDRPFDVKLSLDYSGQIRFMAIDKYNADLMNAADAIVIYGKAQGALNPLSYSIKGSQTTSAGTSGYFTAAYQNKPFPNLFIYMFSGIVASNPTYIDDVSIKPYYKINYDANGGTGAVAPEYFYVASGTSYTLKNTANDLVKGEHAFLGWATTPDATIDDIVKTVTPTVGEDITLYAVYGTPVVVTLIKDGAEYTKYNTYADNVITVNGSYFADADNYYVNWQTEDGKAVIANQYIFNANATLNAVKYARKMTIGENAFSNGDFEENYIEVRPSAGNLFIVEDDAEHGNVLKYQRINSSYGSVQRGVIWETGRKYRIEYDAKLPAVVGNHYNRVFGGADHGGNGTTAIANEWVHTGVDYLHTATDEPRTGDVFTLYMNPVPADVENVVYYDNIKLIPYHKVTFNANGAEGTAPAIDWTLAETYEITATAEGLTKNGFYFAGWSTSADGEAVDSVNPVVGKDIELFAVWAPVADENAPESDTENFGFRAGEKAGMRVYASVTVAQKNEATEYGFVVARADILKAIGYNAAELTHNISYNGAGEGQLFVKGVAYKKENNEVVIDKYIDENDGDIIYAAVCTGLDANNKTQVTTQFVLRPYIKIGDVYAYGKPIVKSLYEVATAVDTTELPEDVQQYIASIIATAEAE